MARFLKGFLDAGADWPRCCKRLENAMNEVRRQRPGFSQQKDLEADWFDVIETNGVQWQRSGGDRAGFRLPAGMSKFRRDVDGPSCLISAAARP